MLPVTISFVSIWDFTARSLSQVGTIAKVAFFKACCMFARRKSASLSAAFRGAHISGFTRAIDMSSQFSGCGCFPRMLVIFSEFSLLPHRLMAISASCCCTFGPFLSSSCRGGYEFFKQLVLARSILFVGDCSGANRWFGQ